MLHLVEDLDRVMAEYKASYQIGTKSTTSEARKMREQRREESPLKRTLSPTYLVFPNWKQLIVKPCLRATFAEQTASLREVRRLSGTSAPEGE